MLVICGAHSQYAGEALFPWWRGQGRGHKTVVEWEKRFCFVIFIVILLWLLWCYFPALSFLFAPFHSHDVTAAFLVRFSGTNTVESLGNYAISLKKKNGQITHIRYRTALYCQSFSYLLFGVSFFTRSHSHNSFPLSPFPLPLTASQEAVGMCVTI